jgi:hypothetical protein
MSYSFAHKNGDYLGQNAWEDRNRQQLDRWVQQTGERKSTWANCTIEMTQNREIPAFRWQFKQNEPKRLAFGKGKTADSFDTGRNPNRNHPRIKCQRMRLISTASRMNHGQNRHTDWHKAKDKTYLTNNAQKRWYRSTEIRSRHRPRTRHMRTTGRRHHQTYLGLNHDLE